MNAHSGFPSLQSMSLLSSLLLVPQNDAAHSWMGEELQRDLVSLTRDEFDELLHLASLNHVVMRGMEVFLAIARGRRDEMRAQWAIEALAVEQRRIANALSFLAEICKAFEDAGCGCCVIKSLDHWPDLGSDIDLYSSATPGEVVALMTRRFGAAVEPRSWGDRLACKWNFQLAGLPELVEIHVGRLGQTGEQIAIASSLLHRTRLVTLAGRSFRVPSKSDRILLSTLQRMYRHFYFRLCDILDSAALVENEGVDFADLHVRCGKGRHLGGRRHLPGHRLRLHRPVSRRRSRPAGAGHRLRAFRRRGGLLRPRIPPRAHPAPVRPALWCAAG